MMIFTLNFKKDLKLWTASKSMEITQTVFFQYMQIDDTDIEELFLKEFNYLTPANSFKQTVIHPKPDVWRWERYDSFMNFTNKNNLMLRVHGPISPQASKWVKDDGRTKEELSLILEEFSTALCKKVNLENSNKVL